MMPLSEVNMDITVPNEFPTKTNYDQLYKIAFIGEAPGEHEHTQRRPFVGPSGTFLTSLLASLNIQRSSCLMANMCQIRPPGNDIKKFDWDGPEMAHGRECLRDDLVAFAPNLCVLLGNTPLRAARGLGYNITEWRGTVFRCTLEGSPFYGFKCLPTFHPAAVLRQYDWAPILKFDLARAAKEGVTTSLTIPPRTLSVFDTADEILLRLRDIQQRKCAIAFDIEGTYASGMECCSIATSATDVFCVQLGGVGGPCWDEVTERQIWHELARVLSDPTVPKILQNSLYDSFVMAHRHGILIRGIRDDTMLKHWELYCELEKSLGFQASIYTNEPFYKHERLADTMLTKWQYCCKDSAVTYEINDVLETELFKQPTSYAHYKFNVGLLEPLLYMQMRGIRYASERASQRVQTLEAEFKVAQSQVEKDVGHPLNINSPSQVKKYLYEERGLPVMKDKKTGQPSTGKEALLKLAKQTGDRGLLELLKLRFLSKRISNLKMDVDSDGRVRCAYNLVGTETGRMACYESPTGSGQNLQTITKADRDLFVADAGKRMFQCDLAGADGWTVAAYCASLGYPTMLDDYYARIKPANIIALMYEKGAEINRASRDELKEMCKTVDSKGWLYFAAKRVQHGSNYDMGPITMATQIMTDSFKLLGEAVYIDVATCKRLQALYLVRYGGIKAWHRKVAQELERTGKLTSPSGHVRIFMGRRKDADTLRAALSHEPQSNTTYATNMALHRLWNDPENHDVNGDLLVEPLHQVHDALIGQYPIHAEDKCLALIRKWFENELKIAGITITIPFEGSAGAYWEDKEVAV